MRSSVARVITHDGPILVVNDRFVLNDEIHHLPSLGTDPQAQSILLVECHEVLT